MPLDVLTAGEEGAGAVKSVDIKVEAVTDPGLDFADVVLEMGLGDAFDEAAGISPGPEGTGERDAEDREGFRRVPQHAQPGT